MCGREGKGIKGREEEERKTIKTQAEKFNELFVNVGKLAFDRTQNELNIVHPHRVNLQQNLNYENFFRPEPVDVNTVILTIKHLKNTNSAGSDGMTLRYLH